MSKKKIEESLEVDMKEVEEKAKEIGKIIDGARFPEILAILGTVIVELEYNGASQNVDVAPVIFDWIKQVGTEVYKSRVKLFEQRSSSELN